MFKRGDKVEVLVDDPCDAKLKKGDVKFVLAVDPLGAYLDGGWAVLNSQIKIVPPNLLTSHIDIGDEVLVREVRYGEV